MRASLTVPPTRDASRTPERKSEAEQRNGPPSPQPRRPPLPTPSGKKVKAVPLVSTNAAAVAADSAGSVSAQSSQSPSSPAAGGERRLAMQRTMEAASEERARARIVREQLKEWVLLRGQLRDGCLQLCGGVASAAGEAFVWKEADCGLAPEALDELLQAVGTNAVSGAITPRTAGIGGGGGATYARSPRSSTSSLGALAPTRTPRAAVEATAAIITPTDTPQRTAGVSVSPGATAEQQQQMRQELAEKERATAQLKREKEKLERDMERQSTKLQDTLAKLEAEKAAHKESKATAQTKHAEAQQQVRQVQKEAREAAVREQKLQRELDKALAAATAAQEKLKSKEESASPSSPTSNTTVGSGEAVLRRLERERDSLKAKLEEATLKASAAQEQMKQQRETHKTELATIQKEKNVTECDARALSAEVSKLRKDLAKQVKPLEASAAPALLDDTHDSNDISAMNLSAPLSPPRTQSPTSTTPRTPRQVVFSLSTNEAARQLQGDLDQALANVARLEGEKQATLARNRTLEKEVAELVMTRAADKKRENGAATKASTEESPAYPDRSDEVKALEKDARRLVETIDKLEKEVTKQTQRATLADDLLLKSSAKLRTSEEVCKALNVRLEDTLRNLAASIVSSERAESQFTASHKELEEKQAALTLQRVECSKLRGEKDALAARVRELEEAVCALQSQLENVEAEAKTLAEALETAEEAKEEATNLFSSKTNTLRRQLETAQEQRRLAEAEAAVAKASTLNIMNNGGGARGTQKQMEDITTSPSSALSCAGELAASRKELNQMRKQLAATEHELEHVTAQLSQHYQQQQARSSTSGRFTDEVRTQTLSRAERHMASQPPDGDPDLASQLQEEREARQQLEGKVSDLKEQVARVSTGGVGSGGSSPSRATGSLHFTSPLPQYQHMQIQPQKPAFHGVHSPLEVQLQSYSGLSDVLGGGGSTTIAVNEDDDFLWRQPYSQSRAHSSMAMGGGATSPSKRAPSRARSPQSTHCLNNRFFDPTLHTAMHDDAERRQQASHAPPLLGRAPGPVAATMSYPRGALSNPSGAASGRFGFAALPTSNSRRQSNVSLGAASVSYAESGILLAGPLFSQPSPPDLVFSSTAGRLLVSCNGRQLERLHFGECLNDVIEGGKGGRQNGLTLSTFSFAPVSAAATGAMRGSSASRFNLSQQSNIVSTSALGSMSHTIYASRCVAEGRLTSTNVFRFTVRLGPNCGDGAGGLLVGFANRYLPLEGFGDGRNSLRYNGCYYLQVSSGALFSPMQAGVVALGQPYDGWTAAAPRACKARECVMESLGGSRTSVHTNSSVHPITALGADGICATEGDEVGCVLCIQERTIHFEWNGVDCGVAFRNVCLAPSLYPAVELNAGGSAVMLI